ncbi:PaaI family thioesterase [Methylobacterium nodulans]|uniref:Thioesterase superfamily protein n=1 Tax=Methylobacterium nodulans (strain LMG 21967 / CNCM I-2342 / ORS 2060) TaxID=460265 RepID=B8IPQ2_METNO|nr:PaaI family thioesterase [Methylobacterium nodulans]ACL56552.1 thioesterase superfamily protein [Methylobacterium nodulans ORS 2060]
MTSETRPTEEPAARRRMVEWSDPRLTARAGRGRSGLEFLRALMTDEVPRPPIVSLLGMEMVSAEAGQVIMRMGAGEHLYNPIGTVHGGALATLLDSVMGCAVHSVLPEGRGYTTLEIKVNYLRPVTEASGVVTAVGEVVHAGRQQAVAEGRVTDAEGRLCATASTTCLLFDLPEAPLLVTPPD